MTPCDHDSRPLFDLLIEPLREKAREHGYALAVHGSLKRDIDLIACPWTSDASDPAILAEALLVLAGTIHYVAFLDPKEEGRYQSAGRPGAKPHGRLCWSIHLGGGPYIDLSVMPRTDPPHPAWYFDDGGDWHPLHGSPDIQFREVSQTVQYTDKREHEELQVGAKMPIPAPDGPGPTPPPPPPPPSNGRAPAQGPDRMLKWFAFEHLPAMLQEVSRPFGELALKLCESIEPGPERTVALRKLLESKDAAVRAKLNPGG